MKASPKKVRVTLDLSPHFYQRLEELLERAEAGTKANLIRQALQLYEYVVDQTLAGREFRVVDKEGKEEKLVFLGPRA